MNKVLRKFCVRGKNLIHLTAYVYEKCLLLQGEDRTFYKKTATSYIGWLPSFSELFLGENEVLQHANQFAIYD
nr:MAG TPA: hypothetical protein [Caudoviricetes sp.]